MEKEKPATPSTPTPSTQEEIVTKLDQIEKRLDDQDKAIGETVSYNRALLNTKGVPATEEQDEAEEMAEYKKRLEAHFQAKFK